MIRSLTLTALFVVFTAMLWGAFALVTRGGSQNRIPTVNAGSADDLTSMIDREWAALSDWDADTYQRHITAINQHMRADIIDRDAANTLTDHLHRVALPKATEAMEREFRRFDCDPDLLSINYEGIQTMAVADRGYLTLPNVEEALATYDLYKKIIDFNRRPLSLRPNFKIGRMEWTTDFPRLIVETCLEKERYIGNSRFPKLRNIDAIDDIYQTESRLDDAQVKYYDELATQIIEQFEKKASNLYDGTEEFYTLKNKYNTVIEHFSYEDQSTSLSRLNNSYRNLKGKPIPEDMDTPNEPPFRYNY